MRKPFAVFIVCPFDTSEEELKLAVVTRDGTDSGKIGLPGGKVGIEESPIKAAMREAAEEGWNITVPFDAVPIHMAVVDGHDVWWYAGIKGVRRHTWKEQHRGIKPELAPLSEVVKSGYGNEWLADAEYALAHHATMAY